VRGYSPFATDDSFSAPASTTLPAARLSRLARALIAKSIVETLFVVALAVYFAYANVNPFFRGSIDVADQSTIEGWVVNEAQPGERVEVHLYINGHFVGRRIADAPRADVLAAGRSFDAYHGFVFDTPPLPPGNIYEARVYAMHVSGDGGRRMLQEFDGGRRFGVKANKENAPVPDVWWESEERR
jgi:predicted RNA-binding protein with TRAM domain